MNKTICFILVAVFLSAITACSSDRAVAQRRSLMIPKKSELPRNAQKYKERERQYSSSRR
jgi:hypothetical protein